MINILHINSAFGKAGAALGMEQLSDALNSSNLFHSEMLVGKVYSDKKPSNIKQLISNYEYYINVAVNRLTGIDSIWYPINHYNTLKRIFDLYDIIHLHNIHGYYFKLKYFELLKNKRVVWTINDYWLLTGKCGFYMNCEKWKTGCGKCPHIEYYPKSIYFDFTSYNQIKKREAINSLNYLYLVAITDVVRKNILQANIRSKGIELIYNGIDLNIYKRNEEIKNVLPENAVNKRKLLILASKIVKRKGIDFLEKLFAAMPECEKVKYHIIIAGNIDNKLANKVFKGIKFTNMGYISDVKLLTAIYSAADLFINPSYAEACQRTPMEAMLCGTPVVAFDCDFIREIIKDTNMLVPTGGDIEKSFLMKIEEYFSKLIYLPEYSRENVRQQALMFSFKDMVDKYIKLYKKVYCEQQRYHA